MIKYKATFADGTSITRKSNNVYAAAWRATWISMDGDVVSETGFSASKENAAKSARPNLPYGTCRGQSSKDRAIANKLNEQFLKNCNLSVEIVSTEAE